MNEFEEGVAPTDARRRPDQRLMENGQWDEANTEKVRFIHWLCYLVPIICYQLKNSQLDLAASMGGSNTKYTPKGFRVVLLIKVSIFFNSIEKMFSLILQLKFQLHLYN